MLVDHHGLSGQASVSLSINLSSFLRVVVVLAIAVTLVGCGRSGSYRYKLSIAVNTPNGIKRGSSVGEVLFWDVSIPARGTMQKLRGDALYLDLGLGARPLIALLTHRLRRKSADAISWSSEAGPDTRLLLQFYGEKSSEDFMDDLRRVAAKRGSRKLSPDDLPDLVTFADVNDPNSVIEVDPNDLQAMLGPGNSWNEITIEVVDEPITSGIEQKLPWIPSYYCAMLDGARYHDKNTLANRLSTADFSFGGPPRTDEVSKAIRKEQASPGRGDCWKFVREWQQRFR